MIAGPPLAESISQDIFCQDCGYNLRGLTGEVCPECGRSLAGLRSDISQIPWVHRKKIGRFRAYWKTVWFVMFRQRQFCDEMVRPVSFLDSQSFRWWTIALAYLPCFAAAILGAILHTQSPTSNEVFLIFWTNGYLAAVVHAGAMLFLAAATGVPSYFFESRKLDTSLRNRAIALSYYACGPLSLIVFPVLAMITWLNLSHSNLELFFMLCTGILPLALFAVWWLDLIHLSRRLLPQKPSRAVWVALMVPFLWLASGFLLVVALPSLLIYPVLIYLSINQ